MARDLMKSIADEPSAGKLFAAAALLGVIAHAFPWRVVKMMGEHTEMGFKIGALGIVSAIALIAGIVVFLVPLMSEMAPVARKNLGLLLVVLPGVAAICELVFWSGTGATQKAEGFGFTLNMKDPASVGWGFYLSLLCTVAAVALGLMRLKALSAETQTPATPSA